MCIKASELVANESSLLGCRHTPAIKQALLLTYNGGHQSGPVRSGQVSRRALRCLFNSPERHNRLCIKSAMKLPHPRTNAHCIKIHFKQLQQFPLRCNIHCVLVNKFRVVVVPFPFSQWRLQEKLIIAFHSVGKKGGNYKRHVRKEFGRRGLQEVKYNWSERIERLLKLSRERQTEENL